MTDWDACSIGTVLLADPCESSQAGQRYTSSKSRGRLERSGSFHRESTTDSDARSMCSIGTVALADLDDAGNVDQQSLPMFGSRRISDALSVATVDTIGTIKLDVTEDLDSQKTLYRQQQVGIVALSCSG